MKQLWLIAIIALGVARLDAQETTPLAAEGNSTAEPVLPAPDPMLIEPLDAAGLSLDDFKWIKRPLIVFADTSADPRFQEQMELLLDRPEELLERDVVVIVDTTPRPQSDIRKKLRPRGFMLTLVGMDGRVNLRKPFPWDVREITRAIDKWPLRKQEIREGKAEIDE